MLLNDHIGRYVLGSLCVVDLVRLGLSGDRVTVARLLKLWLRIPSRAWMSCCCE